jgi:pSer/pThr/pTyr-binding forkhead associated (FHA) protein
VSELTLALIKIGYLALLWLFVFSAVSAMRADIFGTRTTGKPGQVAAKGSKAARPARGAATRLVVIDGPEAKRSIELKDKMIVGRGQDSDIVLKDEYASSRHARFMLHEGQWYVEDLGSTNGVYVSNARISRATALSLSSTVRIGRTTMELRK